MDPEQAQTGTADADPARDILMPLTGVDASVKRLAHDVYYQSEDPQTFETKVRALNLPQAAKRALWDAKYPPTQKPAVTPPTPATPPAAAPGQGSNPIKAFVDDSSILSTARDAVHGAVHGLESTARTVAGPIRKLTGKSALPPMAPEPTIAGAVGKGAEQIGEFLVPASYVSKYGKTLQMVTRLRQAGKTVAAGRLLAAIPEAVMQGITAYGVAKAQGSENPKTTAGFAAAGPVIGAAVTNLAPRVMKSALGDVSAKILKKYKTSTQEIAQTLLSYGTNVTQRGLDKLEAIMDVTDDQLTKVIGSLKGTIDPAKVAARTADVTREFGQQVSPATDLKTIKAATEEFMQHPVHGQPVITGVKQVPSGVLDSRGQMIMHDVPVYTNQTGPLSGEEAQALKRGTYRQLKGKYTKLGSAQVETEKALARGLREEIETLADQNAATPPGGPGTATHQVGEVRALNQQERQIMAGLEATGERLAKLEKPLPAGSIQYAIRWAVHHPYSALSAVAKLEGAPIRSMIARAMASESPALTGSTLLVRAAVQALVSGGKPEADTPDAATAPRPRASRGSTSNPPGAPGLATGAAR